MKRHPGDTLSSAQGAALERDLGFVGKEVSPSHRRGGCPGAWAAGEESSALRTPDTEGPHGSGETCRGEEAREVGGKPGEWGT